VVLEAANVFDVRNVVLAIAIANIAMTDIVLAFANIVSSYSRYALYEIRSTPSELRL
jgi:hypothetical protein